MEGGYVTGECSNKCAYFVTLRFPLSRRALLAARLLGSSKNHIDNEKKKVIAHYVSKLGTGIRSDLQKMLTRPLYAQAVD